ncbi:unnamed protein product [Sphagnum compactum]
MGGWDWASAHCLEKIQEMLSRAIKDQEDLWNMLLASTSSPELQQQRSAASELQGVEAGVYGSEPGQLESAAAGSNRQQQQLNHTCSCCASEFTPTMRNLRHLTAKVENSLDWCHLALCRIKEFTAHSPRSIKPIIKQQTAASTLRYPKLHGPALIPLQIPARDVVDEQDLASLLLSRDETPFLPSDCMNDFINNPGGRTSSKSTLADHPSAGAGADDQVATAGQLPGDHHLTTLSMLAFDLEPSRQGQNIERVIPTPARAAATTGMDTVMDWPDFPDHADSAMVVDISAAAYDNKEEQQLQLTAAAGAEGAVASKKAAAGDHGDGNLYLAAANCNQVKMGAAETARATADDHSFPLQNNHAEDCTEAKFTDCDDPICGRPLTSGHNPSRAKRDREVDVSMGTSDDQKALVVTYQRLRPGVDIKRGIPEDGHRGWKKYGSKSIQNANFCRGYYKCSVKECSAKKSVQPTDKDPSVFEVTYTGTHTCSRTYPRRKTHRIANMQPAATAIPAASAPQVLHESQPMLSTPSHDIEAASACQKQPKPASPAQVPSEDQDHGVGPETPEKLEYASSVVHLPALSTPVITDVVKQKVLHQQATSSSSLSELAVTAASIGHAAANQQLTRSSDLESCLAAESLMSTDSSMPQAAAATGRSHDIQDWTLTRYALIDQEDQHEGGLRNVENMNIDSYCILNELQAAAYEDDDDRHHHIHFANNQLLHNNTYQDFNNFQESCMLHEWRDQIMDHTKFSWSHELAPEFLFPPDHQLQHNLF